MSTARRQWFVLAMFLGLVQGSELVSAQVALPPTGAPASKPRTDNLLSRYLRFDRVTGMTKGAVTTMAQDTAGFLWFGTEEGLSRYDGYEFVNYAPGQANTLSNFTVNALAASKDSLWIGTLKGLNRLDLATNTFTQLLADQKANSIGDDRIVSLHMGRSGQLWIGTAEAGVDSLDPATGAIRHFRYSANRPDSLSNDVVSVVMEDKDGMVWVGTRESGLNQLDPQTGVVTRYLYDPDQKNTLSQDEVTAIYQDKAGTVWVGTNEGLNRFDPATKSFKRYLIDAEDPKWITTIAEGADGGLWLGVKAIVGGVFRFDRELGTIEKYTHNALDPDGIRNPWIRVAFSDRSGLLWFGYNPGEASKLNLIRREFAFYRGDPGISFLETGDTVWVGSSHHALRSFNVKTGEVKPFLTEQLSATYTGKIIAGENDSLWIATAHRGLLHFSPRTGELATYDQGTDEDNRVLDSNAVFSLLLQGQTLWVATGEGLVRLDTVKNTVNSYKSAPDNTATLSSNSVLALHQDRTKPDILWVGTEDGLNEFDKRTGKVVRYLHDPAKPTSLSHDHITDIHEDRAGRLWVATWGGGLNRLDRKTGAFTAYQRASHGLASDTLYGILEDKAGVLWLTTNDGLSKFDPGKETSTNYREGDGLQSDEFGQGSFHQGASGRFYVGGPGGFNVFVPEQLKPDAYVPPVVLTKFELLGESLAIPSSVSLSYRDTLFSVTWSALAYASPNRNHYKYKLTGLQDNWIETTGGATRSVNFSSLSPGDYTLEILGSNAHGVWNEEGIKLPIHVRPPPWRTWWAYGSYCLLAALIVGLFVRRQRNQLEALQQGHRLSELEREMALTSAVQEGFFPVDPSVRDGEFFLEGFYQAAGQCSGDWWWYEVRGDDYFILVGDVTGHGAGSAMVTAAVASCFRSLGTRVDDDTRLQEMNDEVLRVSRGQYHMTLTAMNVNVVTGDYVIRSAGGVPVFSLPPKGRTKVHMCPGMPLGSPDFQVGRLEGRLAAGERILILTDGIPEVAMANTQLLGPRGVSNFYMQTREQELKTALDALIQKVLAVQAGAQDDDWTAVMLQWGTAAQ